MMQRHLIPFVQVGLLLMLLSAPLLLPPYYNTLLNFVGFAAIVVCGLVLLTGVGGLTSFGQALFAGIGAYVTAIATTRWGWSPWVSLPAGMVAAALTALLLGVATLRLSGHYLPLSTIAWGLSLTFLVGNIDALGGHDGITSVPLLTMFGYQLTGPAYTYLTWACVSLAAISVRNILNSRSGRAIHCLTSRRIMAEAFGVDTTSLKLAIFVHAALLASVSGWLYAHSIQFVNPTPFGLGSGIDYLFMSVIGGSSSILGSIVGAASMIFARDVLQDIGGHLFGGGNGVVESVVFGLLMIVFLQRAPQGLMPLLRAILPRGRAREIADHAPPLPAGHEAAAGVRLLDVSNASRAFGGLVAVSDVSLSVRRGEIVALIGPNGAGKSTLFNLITGVLKADAGLMSFQGLRIDGLPSRKIARLGIARTFQHVQLHGEMSAIENVAIGAHLRGRQGLLAALFRRDRQQERSMLLEAKRQLERVGLGMVLDRPADTLALGQQRLLEVARALAADPGLLLLDEPAAGLRLQEKRDLAKVIAGLRDAGIGVFIVEHDIKFVTGLADRIVVMNFGERIAEGTPAEILGNAEVQRAYLGVAA